MAWTVHDVSATCSDTWQAAPLVYAALVYAALCALSPYAAGATPLEVGGSLLLLVGSAHTFALGLDVSLPLAVTLFDAFNVGAQARVWLEPRRPHTVGSEWRATCAVRAVRRNRERSRTDFLL
jgi:hypothetical protein